MNRAAADWKELKERLRRSAAAAERSFAPGAEQIEAVLRRRAGSLANRPEALPDRGGDISVLVFRLGPERYGIEVDRAAELILQPRIAPIPGSPREVAGAIQVRGEIRVVWELTRLLGLPDLEEAGPEYVLILRLNGSREYGLRVGAVEAIRTLAAGERGTPTNAAPIRWITPDLVAILDCDRLWKEEFR
ncbi:MAG: chemotaxis protein CheW [Acidobacteriia bacterium]|nr:chemotaxis protein CheW [Terriglobia bacterium]